MGAVGPVPARKGIRPPSAVTTGSLAAARHAVGIGSSGIGRAPNRSGAGGQEALGTRRCARSASSASSTRVSIGLPGSQSIVTTNRTGMSSRLLPSW